MLFRTPYDLVDNSVAEMSKRLEINGSLWNMLKSIYFILVLMM